MIGCHGHIFPQTAPQTGLDFAVLRQGTLSCASAGQPRGVCQPPAAGAGDFAAGDEAEPPAGRAADGEGLLVPWAKSVGCLCECVHLGRVRGVGAFCVVFCF